MKKSHAPSRTPAADHLNSINTNPNAARHEYKGDRPAVKYYTPGEEAVSRPGQPQNPPPPAVPYGSLGRDAMNEAAARSGQPQMPGHPGYAVNTKSPAEYDETEGER